MRKNVILFILLLMCASGAWAQQTFISAVKISAEEGESTNKQRLRNDGYTVIDQDLNENVGGRYIYIGYKTTTNAAEAITGLLIVESSDDVDVRSSYYKTNSITFRDKKYYRCDSYGSNDDNCDLNRKAGGADITLYYTKDGNTKDGESLITELTTVKSDRKLAGYSYVRHWQYGTDMYSVAIKDIYGDANRGAGSPEIYFPYKSHKHSYTATYNWAADGKSCSVTAHCKCGHSSTGNAAITSEQKTQPTYRIDGITTYTAKIKLNNKEFTGTKDVQDIVMPLAEVKTIVNGMIDNMVAAETRADVSALGNEKKALVDAAATRDEVLAILDAFPADRDATVALALAQAKSNAKAAVQAALPGVTDADILDYGDKAMADIDSATSIAQINKHKEDALAEIQRMKELLQAKSNAKAAIQAALEGVTDEAILAVGTTANTDIDNATFIDKVNSIKTAALAEIQRLKNLAIAKADAIAAIEALVDDTEDALALSEGDRYIGLIRAAQTAAEVSSLLAKATENLSDLLDDCTAVTFTFTGTGMPVETQHAMEELKMTYSNDGEEMTVTVNGAEVTYPLTQVSELTYFRGTPTISLHANQDPDCNTPSFYTTFYSSLEAYTLPEGVKAYTATIDGDVIRMTAIEGPVLPQGEAVLLYSDELSDGNWTMEIADPSSASIPASNHFEGVDIATAQDAASYYMFFYGQNKLGFYKMNHSTMLAANKAFIVLSSSASAKSMRIMFDDEEPTGIETSLPTSPDEEKQVTIYNLHGMKLNKLQKGINIVNGKKIIIQ